MFGFDFTKFSPVDVENDGGVSTEFLRIIMFIIIFIKVVLRIKQKKKVQNGHLSLSVRNHISLCAFFFKLNIFF